MGTGWGVAECAAQAQAAMGGSLGGGTGPAVGEEAGLSLPKWCGLCQCREPADSGKAQHRFLPQGRSLTPSALWPRGATFVPSARS